MQQGASLLPSQRIILESLTSLSVLALKPGLLRWVEDQGPRGLEGYSSRLHAMRRQRHLQDSKHAVFIEQARQSMCNERDDEQLARQAELASRRARKFAILLGQADAWAARNPPIPSGDEGDPAAAVPLPFPTTEGERALRVSDQAEPTSGAPP